MSTTKQTYSAGGLTQKLATYMAHESMRHMYHKVPELLFERSTGPMQKASQEKGIRGDTTVVFYYQEFREDPDNPKERVTRYEVTVTLKNYDTQKRFYTEATVVLDRMEPHYPDPDHVYRSEGKFTVWSHYGTPTVNMESFRNLSYEEFNED